MPKSPMSTKSANKPLAQMAKMIKAAPKGKPPMKPPMTKRGK
jgi:hypothetical protein